MGIFPSSTIVATTCVSPPRMTPPARGRQSFYAFWPRTVSGSLRSAWELEGVRLDRMGKSHWSLRNDIFNAWAMTIVLFGALTAVFGVVVLPYLLIQAVLGFSLLEVVNYLEHYGLLRQSARTGASSGPRRAQLELQQRRLKRAALPPAAPFRPPRQPDAPLSGAAPLRKAPQLPTGYAGMIVTRPSPRCGGA